MKALARREPQEEQEDEERRDRLVELARVQGRVHGRPHRASGVDVGEGHRPGDLRRLPPAAAGGEAAEPPDRLTEHDARHEHVGRLPPGQVVPPRVPPGHEDPPDQAAVEDAPALEDGADVPRVAAEVAPVDGDEHQLRPDEAGNQDPDRHVGDAVRVEPGTLRLPRGDPEAGQEGDGEEDAVGVEGEGPDRAPQQLDRGDGQKAGVHVSRSSRPWARPLRSRAWRRRARRPASAGCRARAASRRR